MPSDEPPKKKKRLPSRKSRKVKAAKKKSPIDTDDVLDGIEFIIEEATGIGIAKRAAVKIRNKIAAQFIEKVERLTKENKELVRTIKEMSHASAVLVQTVEKQADEIAKLEAKLKKREKKQKISSKKPRG